MSHLSFLKESIRSIRTTGAVMRSSRWLVREMLEPIDFDKAKIVVELGAGSGAFTEELLSRMFCFFFKATYFCKPYWYSVMVENHNGFNIMFF